jgi:hypothetical protein
MRTDSKRRAVFPIWAARSASKRIARLAFQASMNARCSAAAGVCVIAALAREQ